MTSKEAAHFGSKQVPHLKKELDVGIDQMLVSRNGVVKALVSRKF